MELGRRRENVVAEQILSSEDIFKAVVSKVVDENREYAYALYLNNSNGLIRIVNVGIGGIDSTLVDVRVVIAEALRLNACAVAFVHNHPSGNLTPSRLDDELTNNLSKACSLMKIRFIDHVIISSNGKDYYSYHDKGKI